MLTVRDIIISLFFCYVAILVSYSQSISYIDHLGSEQGLASQLCQHLLEDDYGNLWITSFLDVQKYDGYEVTVFPTEQINYNQYDIIDLGKDQSGKIWLLQGTGKVKHHSRYSHDKYEYHISIIDPITENVIPFSDYIKKDVLQEDRIANVLFHENVIFLITNDGIIYTYTDKLEYYKTNPNQVDFISMNSDGCSVHLKDNILSIYDQENVLTHKEDLSQFSNFSALKISPSGKLFLLANDGGIVTTFLMEGQKKKKLISLDKKEFPDRSQLIFYDIEFHKNGYLNINDRLYNTIDSSELEFRNTFGSIHSFEYLVSESGLGYVATNLGVYIIDDKKKIFNQFQKGKVELNSVRGIFINDKLKAYRTFNKEVVSSNSPKQKFNFLDDIGQGQLISMHYIDPLDKNELWSVGHMNEFNVRKINFNQKSVEFYIIEKRVRSVDGIIRSPRTKDLYIATDPGFYMLNKTSKTFEEIDLSCAENAEIVSSQIIDKNNEIWIASNKGVIMYNEESRQCRIDDVFSSKIKFGVQFIHPDNTDQNTVWLGTRRGGLIKWDTHTDKVEFYNTDSGLSNNDVHAILEDSHNRLWISTNRYLNCLDKTSGNIYIFTEQDGISHSEFNRWSYFSDTTHNLFYFGGIDGYTYFCPDSIGTSLGRDQIKIRIIDAIKTKNDATLENIFEVVESSSKIEFQEKDVSLNLSLSTNHLYRTKNIQYSYRIPGLIDHWETQNTNEIKLNKLPYGEFKLELIADLNKPAHTTDILVLDIDVVQPFRKTWTARILTALGLLFITWLIFLRYNKTLRERNIKLEAAISERTKELSELNKTKSKIFAILAHDLRNPITSLADITEKIKFLSKHNRLNELDLLAAQTKSKVNALNDNLNNILLWALSENKLLKLRPEKLSLLIEIRKILNLYLHQLEEKNIAVFIDLKDIDQTFVDISVLQTILRNFISNAIKFSYKDGEIHFTKNSESKDKIELKISDQGIGLLSETSTDESSTEKAIRSQGQGSGIGMKISKELAAQARITIRIEPNKVKGTGIYLNLPKR